MIRNIEIRRLSLLIFILTLITAIFIINQDTKTIDLIKIEDKSFKIDLVEIKNERLFLYSKNVIIKQDYITDEYFVGDILKVSGDLQNVLSLKDKGYGLYLKSKGYDYIIDTYKLDKIGYEFSYKSLIYIIRQNINMSIDYLYDDYAGVVKTLLIADRQDMSKDEIQFFSKAGISHIISISGFHILLISGIFFSILFFLETKKRYILSAILTLIYVILTGFKPSAVRAYIFYITYLLSIYKEQRYDIFSIGFILSSLYMVINPYILYDFGFCLSFLSVFSIAIFYNRIFNFFKKFLKNDRYDIILSMFCLTFSALLLTMPYIYYNFGIISIISLFSNLISVPLISICYPFILLSIVFVKVFFIRDVFVNIVNIIMAFIYKSNEILIQLPFSYIEFENRSIVNLIIFYISILSYNHIYVKYKVFKNLNILQEDID